MSSRGLAESFYEGSVGPSPETPAWNGRARFRTSGPGRPKPMAPREEESLGDPHHALDVTHEGLEPAAERVRACGVETYGPARFGWIRATSYSLHEPGGDLLDLWSPDPGNDYEETD